MERNIHTKEEQAYFDNIARMTEKERKDFIMNQSILLEQQQFKPEDFKHFDMSEEEFCRTYGYVDLDDILTNYGLGNTNSNV